MKQELILRIFYGQVYPDQYPDWKKQNRSEEYMDLAKTMLSTNVELKNCIK
jgi:hypothetical protein